MSDVFYVQKETIPPSPPPAGRAGPVAWMRANLFDGWFNSLLTVVALALLAWLLPGIIQWSLIDGVWVASSLQECREINSHGACWAVIVERFDQFIYGFYPSELRWRPNLAFILLFVALAPVLFDGIPHRERLMPFSLLYPVVVYWLLWGGSLWGPAMFVAGFALMGVVFSLPGRFGIENSLVAMGAAAVAGLLWFLGPLMGWAIDLFDAVVPIGLEPVESAKLGGFLLSSVIGLAGITLSLPIGILLALGRRSGLIFIQTISIVFIEFIRGVPLITLLFVSTTVLAYFFPPGTSLDLVLRVVIMVTFFASAYMAEVIRGGLASLSSGQYEAAEAVGLDYWKSMRLIILPQALKVSIPNIVSNFIGLFKDTTLVIVIGLLDPVGLIGTIRADSAWNGIVWEFYVFVGLFFFVACFGMSRYAAYLERKLKTDHR